MKRQLLLSLAALICVFSAIAQDFEFEYEGQTSWYTILDEDAKTCEISYCYGFPKEIKIPAKVQFSNQTYSVTHIGDNAFSLLDSLTSVEIPNSVIYIGGYAFYGCSSLPNVEIPNSVTYIGEETFYGCSSLTNVEIPKSVTFIGTGAFLKCTSLMTIRVDYENKNYCSLDGVLFNKDATSIICCPGGLTQYKIPDSVTEIGRNAFYGCTNLTSVEISNSVTKIGPSTFFDCSSLTYVKIPNSVTKIDYQAFFNCCSLTSIDIPNSVTSIGFNAFANCRSLTSVEIPNSVIEIGYNAFVFCSNLTSVEIPSSVIEIGFNAFFRCNLTSVEIPNSVTSIGFGAFSNPNLNAISVDPANQYYCSIDGVLFNKDTTTILCCPGRKTEYKIPNSVTHIDMQAFSDCSSLTSVEIPNSMTEIGYLAFSKCSRLSSITVWAITPPSIDMPSISISPFDGLPSDATLFVPEEAIDVYKSADYWKNFKNIVGIKKPFTETVDGLRYIFEPSNNTASVTYSEQNSLGNYEGMQSVIVPETVEFEGESYKVTAIGDEAFNNCWGLKAIVLPSTLQTIGKLAFGYCTSLRSVTIPEEVTLIDNEAFTGCSALASVEIGSSVETIGDFAFFGCTGLASLHVPESVKTIGDNAFMGIHWINEVHAKAAEPADAPTSAFSTNAYRSATLVVPDGAVDTYKAHPTWSNFMEIRQASDTPTRIDVVDGTLVVKGSGEVRVYNAAGSQVYCGPAGRISLPAGIYVVATDSLTKKVHI